MEDDTPVYIFLDNGEWVRLPAYEAVCPECEATYLDGDLWWESVIPGEPHLQCECGEQFPTRMDE